MYSRSWRSKALELVRNRDFLVFFVVEQRALELVHVDGLGQVLACSELRCLHGCGRDASIAREYDDARLGAVVTNERDRIETVVGCGVSGRRPHSRTPRDEPGEVLPDRGRRSPNNRDPETQPQGVSENRSSSSTIRRALVSSFNVGPPCCSKRRGSEILAIAPPSSRSSRKRSAPTAPANVCT